MDDGDEEGDVLHCPTCGSEELSREGSYRSPETHARFTYVGLEVSPTRARVCLECGYLLLFVGEDEMRRLRKLDEKIP